MRDNRALRKALEGGGEVIPLFIMDPTLLESDFVSPMRLDFMRAGLAELDKGLRQAGSRLVIRTGQPSDVLEQLIHEHEISAVYAEADYSPYARRRDRAVSQRVPLMRHPGLTIQPVDAVLKADGDAYVVYSPYRRRWKSLSPPVAADLLDAPQQIPTPEDVESEELPELENAWDSMPKAGEEAAIETLKAFAEGPDAPIKRYGSQRDMLAVDGTSRLSPYLRFGMLSAKRAFVAGREAMRRASHVQEEESASAWVDELLWREFYLSILYHFPRVRGGSFRQEYQAIEWLNDQGAFEAWCHGQTGYPVVDAGMRQLKATGWMHNRARMIVASFLVKDLLIDWRWGERWFMRHLIDGDPASNNGGWQWTAGTGTDAAPYFRIFNPVLQGEKYDPEGKYIRGWVPELAAVPEQFLHTPWDMPGEVQRELGCVIGEHYPERIVDHGWARDRTMAAYKAVKG
jgi:deoxyribodipyrimidine photo-lyase